MSGVGGWILATAVAVALCAAGGAIWGADSIEGEWREQMARAGVSPAQWTDRCGRAAEGLERILPLRLGIRGYGRLVGSRLDAWFPLVPAAACAVGCALLAGLGRRHARGSNPPSPALAYLSKRAAMAGVSALLVGAAAPFQVPLAAAFACAGLIVGGVWGYVSNLPPRI